MRTTDVNVSDCTISGIASGTGITMFRASPATLVRNNISGLQTGILVAQSSYARIIDSQITGNSGIGVAVNDSSSVALGGNNISGNGSFGVIATHASAANIVGNNIKNNSFRASAKPVCQTNPVANYIAHWLVSQTGCECPELAQSGRSGPRLCKACYDPAWTFSIDSCCGFQCSSLARPGE